VRNGADGVQHAVVRGDGRLDEVGSGEVCA